MLSEDDHHGDLAYVTLSLFSLMSSCYLVLLRHTVYSGVKVTTKKREMEALPFGLLLLGEAALCLTAKANVFFRLAF